VIVASAVSVFDAASPIDACTEAGTIETNATRATPTISADAVDAVRRG
jgi:hypothetical protein